MKSIKILFFTSLILILLVEIALITQAKLYPSVKTPTTQKVLPTTIPTHTPTPTTANPPASPSSELK